MIAEASTVPGVRRRPVGSEIEVRIRRGIGVGPVVADIQVLRRARYQRISVSCLELDEGSCGWS